MEVDEVTGFRPPEHGQSLVISRLVEGNHEAEFCFDWCERSTVVTKVNERLELIVRDHGPREGPSRVDHFDGEPHVLQRPLQLGEEPVGFGRTLANKSPQLYATPRFTFVRPPPFQGS